MFETLTVFQTARAMAIHAGSRQALIAQNLANADTPGYVARDLPAFSVSAGSRGDFAATMRGDRPGHLMAGTPVRIAQLRPFHDENADPNQNGVTLEDEMMRAAEVRQDHDRALAIYRSTLTVLRASLGRA